MTLTPTTEDELAGAVREAHDARRAIYPVGGGTSLDFGLPPKREGQTLSTLGLAQLVDYPYRDMTITVGAGMRVAELARCLRKHGQWLPIDIPQPEQATIGGAIASNASGSRRFSQGTLRDYLLGATAVDGRGVLFHCGGRVVKNVAGYDLGKLLIGSLGALAVVTQATFKVKPLPAASAFLVVAPDSMEQADRLLTELGSSRAAPASVDWLRGPHWTQMLAGLGAADPRGAGWIVVGLEGTEAEVVWMTRQLAVEWEAIDESLVATPVEAPHLVSQLWERLREFPAEAAGALTVRISAPPSAVVAMQRTLLAFDPLVSILAHAASGVVTARFAEFPQAMVSRWLIGTLQQQARGLRGHVVVLRSAGLGELTRQAVWGPTTSDRRWWDELKRQFDPADVLNPGRFVFEAQ